MNFVIEEDEELKESVTNVPAMSITHFTRAGKTHVNSSFKPRILNSPHLFISQTSSCSMYVYQTQPSTGNYIYRPHTEYDGKVMFSVCLFTGGPPGYPPIWGGGLGVPSINLDKNVGQILGQKMDKVLDKNGHNFGQKIWTKCWTKNGQNFGQKNWTNILETFGGGGRGRNTSCGHAGGLSCCF